jgi:hypothetical protein
MKSKLQKAIIGTAGLVLFSTPAMAAFTFTDADIVLGFQATGGQGASTSLYFNLGSSTAIRDNPNIGLLGNISTDLVATYGANWFTRTDLYFGAFGNRENGSTTTNPGSPPAIEAGRTAYVSSPTLVIGGAGLRAALSNASLGAPLTQYAGMRTNLTDATNPTAIVDSGSGNNVALQADDGSLTFDNSWTDRVTTPGNAFGAFSGIEQVFGPGTDPKLLDIQRMAPSTASTWETTVSISSTGAVSLIPEPSSGLLALGAATLCVLRRRRA